MCAPAIDDIVVNVKEGAAMRSMTLGRLLLLIGIVSSVAVATPINYTINFNVCCGPVPTGSFTYDASQPVGSQFSNFDVIWDGRTYDLTSTANSPLTAITYLMEDAPPGTGCPTFPTSADFFNYLNGIPQCGPNDAGQLFGANDFAGGGVLGFCDSTDPHDPPCNFQATYSAMLAIERVDGPGGSGNATDGFFSIQATTSTGPGPSTSSPEPSTLLLTLAGVAILARTRGAWRN